ncbi:uncharacterized protein [Palaemon carinicauda]|uniref:uncharacterized protein n=1 Tax=Palaemon carinicauda TaxID=392227 RepID=UPI0035B5FD50
MDTKLIFRVVGTIVLLSMVCQGKELTDVLAVLEKQFEAIPSPTADEFSRSASEASSSSSSTSGRAPQIKFETPSILSSPIASNLAKLISNALGTNEEAPKEAAKEKIEDLAEKKGEEGDEEDALEDESDVTTPSDRLDSREDLSVNDSKTAGNSSRADESKVDFTPASAEQFGELGTGSKLMEYLPDFSQMSVEANDLAGIAGVGLAGLMAVTAIFAVPVAPVILRRTGNNGWAGLPSWSDLFSWWSTPEPAAEAWVDKHNQGYDYRYDYDSAAYPHNGQQYYAYDTSSSGSEQAAYYAETDTNHVQYASPEEEPTHEYDAQAAYAQQPAYHQQEYQPQHPQHPPEAYNIRQRNRRPAAAAGVDGHEYVTLEQLNRIGEDSVKYLSELAKGYTPEDLYAYRDGPPNNELRRRRLPAPEASEGRYPSRPQYQPQPSYVQSQQYFKQGPQGEEKTDEGPEGFPHKDVFSITQPDSKEEVNYEPHSPYYHSQTGEKDGSAEQAVAGQGMEKQMFKVSDFPYSFERK